MKHAFESAVFWAVMAALMIALVSAVSQASEKEREHEHNNRPINNVIVNHDDNQLGKGIAIGVLATCGLRSLYYGLKDNRFTWCGEPKPKPDRPKPGPVLNDITPDNPAGIKLYQ